MEKIYILDTNVLIQAPYAVECFEENEVVLPMTVLEELDNLKKEEGEKGANVRRVIRILDAYREKGNLLEGVYTGHGGILRVEKNYLNVELPEDLPDHKSDNRILKVCIGLSKESPKQVILVTKDILLRIKAQLLGIQAEDFTTEQVAGHEEQYLGRKEVFVPEVLFKDFKTEQESWLYEFFLEHGILIRSCKNYRELDSRFYRICVRSHEENREFLEILKDYR